MTDLSDMIHAMADERLRTEARLAGDPRSDQHAGVLALYPADRAAAPVAEADGSRRALRLLG